MADIEIERSHSMSSQDLKARLVSMEEKLRDRFGVQLVWRGDTADVKGTGVTGEVSIEPQRVAVRLKLGMLIRPFTSKIRETMEKQIDKALA
jgi:putative polyhydroxyalkanoate system protein